MKWNPVVSVRHSTLYRRPDERMLRVRFDALRSGCIAGNTALWNQCRLI
jgi:hypothetical protein